MDAGSTSMVQSMPEGALKVACHCQRKRFRDALPSASTSNWARSTSIRRTRGMGTGSKTLTSSGAMLKPDFAQALRK